MVLTFDIKLKSHFNRGLKIIWWGTQWYSQQNPESFVMDSRTIRCWTYGPLYICIGHLQSDFGKIWHCTWRHSAQTRKPFDVRITSYFTSDLQTIYIADADHWHWILRPYLKQTRPYLKQTRGSFDVRFEDHVMLLRRPIAEVGLIKQELFNVESLNRSTLDWCISPRWS